MADRATDASAGGVGMVIERKRRPFLVEAFVRIVTTKPLGTVGLAIILFFFSVGVLADLITPHGYNEIMLEYRLHPPSARFWLGTDNLGRDLLSRIIYGARISMYVGLGASLLNSIIGLIIGGISGYVGGKTDLIIQRFVDAWMCFPPLVIYLTVMSLLGPGLWQVILVLGISGGIRCRTERSIVIAIRENVYLEAARATGCPTARIFIRHVVPNILPGLIIIFSVSLGGMIMAEATLSFLGFGIPPPHPSWGGMLSGAGRQYMYTAPWMAIWPGLALSLVVYGLNMFGDAVRDVLDPRLRGGLGRYSGVKIKRPKVSTGF